MATYHIHMGGMVQGVGFRPFVCRLAAELGITGWVSNTNNGLHIRCNAGAAAIKTFYSSLAESAPSNAVITSQHIEIVFPEIFDDFTIQPGDDAGQPQLLLTPDMAICDDCRRELFDIDNKRHRYPFTTCLNCGPRYSISHALPYDRINTSMAPFAMCTDCHEEYHDIHNRRHYSQTNSCPHCAIPMHLYSSSRKCEAHDSETILSIVQQELQQGRIIAVKSIGGYLLLCDATNATAVNTLRIRKQRPAKPFALLYPSVDTAGCDALLRPVEINALKSRLAPIVLCPLANQPASGICTASIAPGLDKIGIMLPGSPLLLLIAADFGKPLVATSGNISGSPIVYKDKDALQQLFEIADYVLTYDREILAPQDDSVLQFTDNGQQIILRRSRGLAPDYFPHPFSSLQQPVLAMGADLKSAFALLSAGNLYISQYLGQQGSIESETAYHETLQQLTQLLKARPAQILTDKHPGYFTSGYGKEIATADGIPLQAVQHHKAHFGSVLAENNLLNARLPILGLIWDGTGYGDDGQSWGGEVFLYEEGNMERMAHLDYFPQLLGDKMSREPRLSALSLLKHFPDKQPLVEKQFSVREWQYYQQLLQQPAAILTSSMGRFLDGIAAILGICTQNTYEAQAAMQLETMARGCSTKETVYYAIPVKHSVLDWNPFLIELMEDLEKGKEKAVIAWKVFASLARMVDQLLIHYNTFNVAFSGGVFQNALLVDLLKEKLPADCNLFFHRQLSANDECIGFGQLACFSMPASPQETATGQIEQNNSTITNQPLKTIPCV